MSSTLLVTGASGQLGMRLAALALGAGWKVVGTFLRAPAPVPGVDWRRLDITDCQSVARLCDEVQPQAVVHAAAVVGQPDMWRINADGAAHVAAAAVATGARLVHISSDALFDGKHPPYRETDDPSPINVYGASKAAAETAVRAIAPAAAIVRTSLILDDAPLDKHSRMILDIWHGRRQEALFRDEIRCPIAAVDLAAAVLELVGLSLPGIFHIAGADAISRYELGMLVARRHGLDPSLLPGSSIQASGLHRPADVRLDMTIARAVLQTRPRGAREVLGG